MTTALNQICGTACPPQAKSFAGKLEKGHERGGEDQISSSVGPCKRWSPWERLWDHNARHKTAGAPASCLKRTCLSTRANWSGELEKGDRAALGVVEGGVSRIHRLNEGLWVVEPIELSRNGGVGVGMQGDWRGRGVLLVIIWSLSTTPASHSPTPEGSRPCCVYHWPPMDSLKSDRNKRQDCALPPLSHLPEAYPLDLGSTCLSEGQIIFWLSLHVYFVVNLLHENSVD